MPVRKCPNGKYRIGSGDCIYKTKSSAERAMIGYYASKKESAQNLKNKILEDLHKFLNKNNG